MNWLRFCARICDSRRVVPVDTSQRVAGTTVPGGVRPEHRDFDNVGLGEYASEDPGLKIPAGVRAW